eukprot:scaffold7415_cov170-Amphora_coffeaeformis.AAC.11
MIGQVVDFEQSNTAGKPNLLNKGLVSFPSMLFNNSMGILQHTSHMYHTTQTTMFCLDGLRVEDRPRQKICGVR